MGGGGGMQVQVPLLGVNDLLPGLGRQGCLRFPAPVLQHCCMCWHKTHLKQISF